jgi:hypothetical protein
MTRGFENKVSMRIFGPVQEDEEEPRFPYTDPDMFTIVQARELGLIGHILRRKKWNHFV